ncbi:PFU-domain-containing protein [Neoconidiobolus thromboides FSU 785]|nr:PFU-domain-containing protein [Neoconidiobolus thromboides FSU 785]
MNDYYQLSKEIVGHEQDIKGVDYNTLDGSILSVSRDGSLRVNGDKIYLTTNKFLNCVKYLPKSEKNDEYYLSAGSAKTVYIHHPQQLDSAIMSLTGHNDNICCIDLTEDHRIITGSWDKTIKVWKDFNLQFTFFGHEQAVWAVKYLKSKQWIVSGSADKTIKVWDANTGSLIHTIQAHTDCVRSIDEVKNLGFISCGNDGVVKVWDYSFNLIQELHGHTSFVYSVQTIDPEQFLFASSGEDRSIRIWKEGKCIQTITLPALSIWTLKVLPNQNIVAGSSDSVVRVFTKIQEEVADNDTLKAFEEKVGQQSINTNQVGDIQKEKLEDVEGLQKKGKKEGEVKMIRNNLNNVEAYQWSMNNQEWVKIGEVVDAVGNSRKQLYQGKEYDYVFDINLSEGAPNLKLPYNVVDNPFTVAMNFIQQNQLPVEYLDQIVQFINQNGKPITIDSNTNNTSNFANPDPYTGSNRNKGISTTTTTSTIINEKINYTKINIDQVMNKFDEFNLLQSYEVILL